MTRGFHLSARSGLNKAGAFGRPSKREVLNRRRWISRQAWQLSRAVACSCRTSASRDHRQDLGGAATARRPQTATHVREHGLRSERWTFFYDYRAAGRGVVSDWFLLTLSSGACVLPAPGL